MKPPDYLVPKNRVNAIHFTQRTMVESPLYGPMETYAIACGQKLDAKRWSSSATREAHLVTCSECWRICHPREVALRRRLIVAATLRWHRAVAIEKAGPHTRSGGGPKGSCRAERPCSVGCCRTQASALMHRYPHHIGDYAAHTRHLSEIEDLAYRRMLELYYLHEHPLTGRPEDIARAIGMSRRTRETQSVLAQFFTQEADGWHNKRADRELTEYWSVVDRNRKNGRLGGRPRKRNPDGSMGTNPDGLVPLPSPLSPVPEVPPSPSGKAPQKTGAAPAARRPQDVSEQVWEDWCKHRRAKRASVTETVVKQHRAEAEVAGISLEQALAHCASAGWQGFRAEWWAKDHTGNGSLNGRKGMRERFEKKPQTEAEKEAEKQALREEGWIVP